MTGLLFKEDESEKHSYFGNIIIEAGDSILIADSNGWNFEGKSSKTKSSFNWQTNSLKITDFVLTNMEKFHDTGYHLTGTILGGPTFE